MHCILSLNLFLNKKILNFKRKERTFSNLNIPFVGYFGLGDDGPCSLSDWLKIVFYKIKNSDFNQTFWNIKL